MVTIFYFCGEYLHIQRAYLLLDLAIDNVTFHRQV